MTDATPDPMVPVDMMLTSVPENVWREMKKLEGKIDKDERDKKYAVQKSVQPPPKYLHLLAPKNAPAKSYMPVAPSAPTSQAQAARPSAPPAKRARMNPPVRGRVVISGRGGTSGAGAGRGASLTRTDSSSFKGAQSQIMAGSPLKGRRTLQPEMWELGEGVLRLLGEEEPQHQLARFQEQQVELEGFHSLPPSNIALHRSLLRRILPQLKGQRRRRRQHQEPQRQHLHVHSRAPTPSLKLKHINRRHHLQLKLHKPPTIPRRTKGRASDRLAAVV
ncbi:hypothetical protein BT69DRAFT_50591 [Atractiella rhizophila]|nr:hypothetical protein BT69DRAFT_50591 [Atractiella rhizophila]